MTQKETNIALKRANLMSEIEVIAAKRGGQAPVLLAVSKFQSVEAIREAYAAGQRDFGENYVQELIEKQDDLTDLADIRWHFIGALQSNKIKLLKGRVYLIHSVDRLKLLQEMDRVGGSWNFLIQLEIDPTDHNKAGCTLNEAKSLKAYVESRPQLKHQGYMGIGPAENTESELSLLYSRFLNCCQDLGCAHTPPIISLGMSGDLAVAINHGSTMVRIGTAFFGKRK